MCCGMVVLTALFVIFSETYRYFDLPFCMPGGSSLPKLVFVFFFLFI